MFWVTRTMFAAVENRWWQWCYKRANEPMKEESSRVHTLWPGTRDPTVSLIQSPPFHSRLSLSCHNVTATWCYCSLVASTYARTLASKYNNSSLSIHLSTFLNSKTDHFEEKRMAARNCSDTDTVSSNLSLRCRDMATQSSQNSFAWIQTQFHTTTNGPLANSSTESVLTKSSITCLLVFSPPVESNVCAVQIHSHRASSAPSCFAHTCKVICCLFHSTTRHSHDLMRVEALSSLFPIRSWCAHKGQWSHAASLDEHHPTYSCACFDR